MQHDKDAQSILGETVHTAFRKGCDGGGSHEVWVAIKQMDQEQWGSALEWMLYALDVSGFKLVRKDTP